MRSGKLHALKLSTPLQRLHCTADNHLSVQQLTSPIYETFATMNDMESIHVIKITPKDGGYHRLKK